MSEIALRNVCKQFDSEHYGVKDFNLDIHDKEFVIFVGPSGCGKSTTLRIIAGLEEITDGELWIDGELSNYLEPKERGMSMVFQNYALYPNMTVYGNMAYALKIRKLPKDEIDRKVHEVAKILEIDQLLDRRPAALSGGQKQRVAIGSAIDDRQHGSLHYTLPDDHTTADPSCPGSGHIILIQFFQYRRPHLPGILGCHGYCKRQRRHDKT